MFPISFQNFRKQVFEKSSVVTKILPKSLLQLFVDIEFTGDSMEFYQKFGKYAMEVPNAFTGRYS